MLSCKTKRSWIIFKESEETYDAEAGGPPHHAVFITFI